MNKTNGTVPYCGPLNAGCWTSPYGTVLHSLAITTGVFFTISFFLMRQQPVKSRFITPFVAIVIIIITNIFNILQRWVIGIDSDDGGTGYLVYVGFDALLLKPLSNILLLTYLVQLVRYFLMRSFHNQKLSHDVKNQRLVWFYKFLTSKIVFVVAIILCGLLTILFDLPFYIASVIRFEFYDTAKKAILISNTAVKFSLGILTVCTYLLDTVMSKNRDLLLKCDLRGYYITYDPLFFRIEMPFYVCGFISIIIAYIISNVGASYDFFSNQYIVCKALYYTFTFISDMAFILAFGGVACVIQLNRLLIRPQHKNGTEDRDTILQTILENRNSVIYESFVQYVKNELSSENILIWEDLQLMQDSPNIDPAARRHAFEAIRDQYMLSTSPNEANVAENVLSTFKTFMNQHTITGTLPSAEELEIIKLLSEAIYTNLSDTFFRFRNTQLWITYVELESLTKKSDVA
jgi:hypothetical protein